METWGEDMPVATDRIGDNVPTIKPEFALVVHRVGYQSVLSNSGMAVTRHAIQNSEGGPLIGAGRLVDNAELISLGQELIRSGEEQTTGNRARKIELMPDRVLAQGLDHIVWQMPAAVRPMWFRVAGAGTHDLTVPWPNLVLARAKGRFMVAALETSARPTADTPLHHAPLMNIDDKGSVCLGNASGPKGYSLEVMAGWEAVLTDSAFSHTNHGETIKADRHCDNADHLRFWRKLHRRQASAFPTDALVPMDCTLQEWLEEVGERL